MDEPSSEELERGKRTIAQLNDIMPSAASADIQTVYEDIQTTLRVPIVAWIFRLLANFPRYLESNWYTLKPVLESVEFESAADSIRRQAVPSAPLKSGSVLRSFQGIKHVVAATEPFHYVIPKLLMIATVLHEGLHRTSHRVSPRGQSRTRRTIPRGVPQDMAPLPQMLDRADAKPEVRAVLEMIQRHHGYSGLPSYYRVLANWPEILTLLWGRIERLTSSDSYADQKLQVLSLADACVEDLWGSEPIAGCSMALEENRRAMVRDVLAVFRYEIVPQTLIEVGAIKSLIQGRRAAQTSRFSALL